MSAREEEKQGWQTCTVELVIQQRERGDDKEKSQET